MKRNNNISPTSNKTIKKNSPLGGWGVFFACLALLASCNGGKTDNADAQRDTLNVGSADSTIYGKCGEGTMMNTLELVTDDGKTLTFTIDKENGSDVQGGMMSGDRMAVTYCKTADENIAHKVINLTTLLGRWTSLDKNFTINEDGSIESSIQAESKPYTAWTICNAISFSIPTPSMFCLSVPIASLWRTQREYLFIKEVNKRPTPIPLP